MALVEFKKNKNPKNKIIMGIGAFVLLLIILSITRTIFGMGYRTTTATPSVIVDKIDGTGLVIKSEKVYSATSSGTVEPLKEDGEKIAVGKEIVNVITTNEDILAQLDHIEKQIEDLGVKYYSEEENENLLEDIQEKINQGNYNDINDYLEEKNSSTQNSNLVSENLEALLIKQQELNELLDGANHAIVSEDAGILSYEVDGYEEILKPLNFENYNYAALNFDEIRESMKDKENSEEVTGGSPLFKIIDNYVWYIALKIDDARILEFEEGQGYDVQLNEEETVRGKIVAINAEESKGVIVIEFKDQLHEFYNSRIVTVGMIKSETNAYEIPTRSLIEKDGQAGVYINHVYGIVRFVPVNILGEDDDITYVDKGNNDAYITIEGEEIRTITQFDEIFLNPSNLEENQILR